MKPEKTIQYLKQRLKDIRKELREYKDRKDKYEIEKKEILAQIDSYKKQIDEAYDVFSPKSEKNTFYKEQIAKFEEKLKNANINIEEAEQKCSIDRTEIKELETAIFDVNRYIKEVEKSLHQKEILNQDVNKEIEYININQDNKNISEKEQNNYTDERAEVSKKQIRDIIYKCENTRAFMSMDINRSKLEIEAVIALLQTYAE